MPSAVWPGARCSSSSSPAIEQRPGTGSTWGSAIVRGPGRSMYHSSSKSRRTFWTRPGSSCSRCEVGSPTPSRRAGDGERPSTWSKSECVISSPTTLKRAWSAIEGKISSSSGSTGESMQNASSPERTSVQVVCQKRDVTTTTSGWSPTAFNGSGRAEELGRLEEGLHLGGRLLLRGVELLLVAVDPHHGDLGLDARLDVVVVVRRHVHPALLAADAALALLEVRGVGLVGADLLGGHDEVEVGLQPAAGLAEQLVVDVGDQPDLELLLEPLELGVGLLERRPALDRVGEEPGAGGLQRPAELLGDLHGGAPQDLGVQLVGAALDLLLGLLEERDELVAGDGVAVFLGFLRERLVDPGIGVDQGSVHVEGDEGDFFRERHEGGGL